MAVHKPDKINFQSKLITRDRGHYIVVQGSVHQKDVTAVNMYVPNIEAPKKIFKANVNILKWRNSNTVIVGNHRIPLSTLDKSSRQN